MDEEKKKNKEYAVGYKIGQVFAIVAAYCIMAVIVALTAGCIIKFFQWLF